MKHTTLGAYIRSLRIQNEMTQAQLADKVGVTDKAVSKWERDLSYPDVALFPKLADLLGVTVDDLLNGCLDEEQPSRLLQILGMNHDIRTPLHIILGCVNLAELHQNDPELIRRYLKSIRISGEYLLKSIDYLMQVTYRDQKSIGEKEYPANVRELGEYLNRREEARINAGQEYDFSGRRILVAEDILLNREILSEFIRQTGASADYASDGRECLKKIEEAPAGHYDLILMDIMMPEMDGLEATRRIRALPDPRKASIPIIAVSADVNDKERQAALDAGMNDFTEKPIFVDQLMETMKKYI